MTRDLRFEAVYPHPIDKVWRAITEPDAIARWLMQNDFAPRVGHRFHFTAPPQPGWDGIVNCEVLAIEPPTKLAYSWKGGPLDTIVTISLTPAPGGTRLVLDHTGFRGSKASLVSLIMGRGWKGIVAKRIPDVIDQMGVATWCSLRSDVEIADERRRFQAGGSGAGRVSRDCRSHAAGPPGSAARQRVVGRGAGRAVPDDAAGDLPAPARAP